MKKFLIPLLFAVSLLTLGGCTGGYSFTGASIPAEAKTISITQFPNYASTVNPQLSQKLYDGLQQMFSSQTSLNVTSDDGDLQITGEITDYSTRASSIGSDDNVATNRFTITIKVSFTNRFDSKADFEQTFSRFKDYAASRDFSSVEQSLTDEIVTELCEDIFNKSVVNW
ncbi:MAG: LptE family protein [Bacteroidales bacterium]|nr:LptE family protein [Bacteroidales bacterium]